MTVSQPSRRPGLIAASPLRHADYRVLCLATTFQGVGFIGETVVLGWLLLEKTDSAFIVGLGIALRALPSFLLGLPGGAIADRVDRRAMLRLVGFAMGLNMAIPAVLAFSGELSVASIMVFAFIGGSIRAIGQAARQSYAFDIVGPGQAVGGMAFITLGQRLGGIAGSLGAGFLLQEAGAAEAYLAVAISLLLSGAVMLLAKTPGQAAPLSKASVWQGSREYLVELGRNRTLATLVGLTAAVEIFGFSHQAALPSLARDLLDVGPEGLGLLNAAGSAGAILAILAVSLRGEPAHRGRLFLVVLLLFGGALVLLGNGSTYVIALIGIAVVSSLAALTDLLSQTLVQASVPNELRGRAMGSWVLAIGLGPVGHLQIGALIAVMGVTMALVLNGVALVLLAVGALIVAREIRRL